MFSFLRNNSGASMLQVLIIGGVVLTVGGGVMKMSQTQRNSNSAIVHKIQLSNLIKEMTSALSDPEVCKATLHQTESTISNGIKFDDGIVDKNGDPIFKVAPSGTVSNRQDFQYGGKYEIKKIQLIGFDDTKTGLFSTKSALKVSLEPYTEAGIAKMFGLYGRTEYIPLMMIVRNNKIEVCMSDEGDKSLLALEKACLDFGGDFDSSTAVCSNIAKNIIEFTQDTMCSPTDSKSCKHPYINESCSNTTRKDRFNIVHNNLVIDGFSYNSSTKKVQVDCACVPQPCPLRVSACLGEVFATNGCGVDCPAGTKKNEDCCGAWTPTPSSVCNGFSFTQNNGAKCGNTRPNIGTQPIVWLPNSDTVCSGANFTQTRTCDGKTRTVQGTAPIIWSPSTSTVCAGATMTQTRTCDGQTRVATGTRNCTCYGGIYGPGCNWPTGTLGQSTSFGCNAGGAAGGTCSASCVVEMGMVKWKGTNSCYWAWYPGSWESCTNGTQIRRYFCGNPGFCSGSRPAPETKGC